MKGFMKRLRQKFCSHTIAPKFHLTGIEEPEVPTKPEKGAGYSDWVDYYQKLHSLRPFPKRVSTDCLKCGKSLFAHCGLDLLRVYEVRS